MTEPLVSICMITYNHEPYIRQAIESVLAQITDFSFEFVIGEDCSTDGTREIVYEYANRYPHIIHVVTSEQNVGMKKNDYRTIMACRGKYVAFCEGDDYWHNSRKLQIQVDFLEKQLDCGMVISDCNIFVNHKNKQLKNINFNKGHTKSRDITLEEAFGEKTIHIFTCTAMVRRNLLCELISNDPHLYQSEQFLMSDVQLWIELALNSKVYYIAECHATYRILQESASFSQDQLKMIKFWISGIEMRRYLCEKYNLPKEILNKLKADQEKLLFRLAFYEKNTALAEKLKKSMIAKTLKNYFYFYATKNKYINLIVIKLMDILWHQKNISA